jgi:hypothetical protein
MDSTIRTAFARVLIAGVLVCASSGPALAQAAPAPDDAWHFQVAPYMWFAGVEGTLSVRGIVDVPVDVPFDDVISDFDIGLLAHFEGRKHRAGFAMDVLYLSLSAPVADSAPILAQLKISADVRLAMVEGLGFYRVATGGRSDNPAHLDVIAGVRYFGTSGRLEDDVLQTGELKLNWVDALVGARFRVPLGSRVALLGRGDIAGFGSNFCWNVEGDLAVPLSRHWTLGAGWRHFDIDYDKDEGTDHRVFDVAFDGPRAWFNYSW